MPARSFITKGPAQASGSRIGRPPTIDHVELRRAALLAAVGGDGEVVAGAEHGGLPGAHGTPLDADRAVAVEDVDERVELDLPRQLEAGTRLDGGVHQRHRGVRRAGTGVPVDRARDHPHRRSGVGRGQQGDLTGAQVLVLRRGHLRVAGQVHPQLDAVEETARLHQPLRRRLDVQQPGARGHPLGVAVRDRAAATVAVLVVEGAVDDVGDGLEAAVRVPRRALGLARGVLHLAHLVHHDEGVERREVDARERAADREALPLVALRRRRHLQDLAGLVSEARGADPVERGQVVDGDGGHEGSPGPRRAGTRPTVVED